MIADALDQAHRYALPDADLGKAFAFIETAVQEGFPEGRYEIDRDRIVGLVQSYATAGFREDEWESHDRHADLHAVIAGEETIHWTLPSSLVPEGDFDPLEDARMHRGGRGAALPIPTGWFALFLPREPHQPRCTDGAPGRVRKIVVKILLEETTCRTR